MKKIILLLLCLSAILITGCNKKEIKTSINEEELIAINYPVTGINALDDAVSSYINKTYNDFKKQYKNYKKPELNISYTYKELNKDIINVSLNTEIITDKKTNKIKTFTYNKKNKTFLTMEDIIKDLEALDYNIKKQLLEKYRDNDIDLLTNISYDYFTIDDENLTLYLGPKILKEKGPELIYLDIPLNSLKLLIDIDKTENTDNYIKIKKKNIDIDDKVVALTFDDGPSKYTAKILDVLYLSDAGKPALKAYERILHLLKCNKKGVAAIGDQMITDIVGAKKYGIYAILVDQLSEENNIQTGTAKKLQDRIEKKLKKKKLFQYGKYYQ